MRTSWPMLAVLGGALAAALGCDDNTAAPEIQHGAGIRIQLPAGASGLAWLRVELWDDNATPPPDCAASPAVRGPKLLAAEPNSVECTRKAVIIWNLVGETVLSIPDTTFDGKLPLLWDGRDGDGNPAPSGYYPTFARCLDENVDYTFTGAYFLWQDRELGACRWPLWIHEMEPAPATRTLAFGPFPEALNTTLFDEQGLPQTLVVFENPFLVRVEAPGMEVFEREITLRTGEFSDVNVTFTPLAGSPETGRDGTIR
jgi:hypothetical protein